MMQIYGRMNWRQRTGMKIHSFVLMTVFLNIRTPLSCEVCCQHYITQVKESSHFVSKSNSVHTWAYLNLSRIWSLYHFSIIGVAWQSIQDIDKCKVRTGSLYCFRVPFSSTATTKDDPASSLLPFFSPLHFPPILPYPPSICLFVLLKTLQVSPKGKTDKYCCQLESR